MATGKRKPATKREQATAYHEAGHVVMAIHFRRAFKRVTIVPDDEQNTLGMVTLSALDRHFCTELELGTPPQSKLDGERQLLLPVGDN